MNIARKNPKDFTRNRVMPFEMLIHFLIDIVHESLQTAARRFFEKANIFKTITEQSLSAARNKLNWEAFRILFKITVESSYEDSFKTWRGYTVFATDGTTIELPHYPILEEIFGEEKGSPLARGSALFDVHNRTVVDAQIAPLRTDERTLAKKHIEALSDFKTIAKPFVIYDRGYASGEFIRFHKEKNIKFLFRVKTKFNNRIDSFKKKDGSVYLFGMRIRIVKITLDSGETETLITNEFKIPYCEFKELYFMRWEIEKEWNIIKNKLEVTNFSGRTENAIRQDFFIHMMYGNILNLTEWEAQEEIDEKNADKKLKYDYKINTNHAIGVFRDNLTRALLAQSDEERARIFDKILTDFKSATVPIRPDRKIPRIKNTRKAKHHHNHKANL